MSDNDYWLLGEVKIPNEKKEELNKYVLQLLEKGGIRKTEEIMLENRKTMVVKKAVPNEEGIVYFDYSIFEKKVRDTSTYNMNTCKLDTSDRGYNEFGMVMNLIMFLQESYTNGECYLMYKDKPLPNTNTRAYLKLLHCMLGKKFFLNNRGRVWEMLLFFRSNKETANLSEWSILDAVPRRFAHVPDLQKWGIIELYISNQDLCDEERRIRIRNMITDADYMSKKEYLYEKLSKLQEVDSIGLELFLKELLDSNVEKRKLLAKREDDYGAIAELSLYMLPINIVNAYAVVRDENFWEIWNQFHIKGYTDVLFVDNDKVEHAEAPDEYFSFRRAIRRETEDEFLEFWNGKNLILSGRMIENIENWKRRLEKQNDILIEEVEGYLAEILSDLKNDWNCRLIDKEFIDEMLNNKDDNFYRKALALFRELMDKDSVYFPELTQKQALNWVIKGNRRSYENIMVCAYQSLLINREQRKIIFGF